MARFAAGEPTDAERAAYKFTCELVATGALYEHAMLALPHTHELTQGQREAVAALAYKVGEPLTREASMANRTNTIAQTRAQRPPN